MAKTYIDIVKYMVEARFEVNGMVDKPDIIGAVFGQTEGLLGSDLDLRELQKNGKIGRIEIESGTSGSKTYGKLFLPASLNRVETCILASAVEAVDRVGPFETSVKIEKIVDTRSEKRNRIITRAKVLLKNMLSTEIPDSKELSELVEADVKLSEVISYGPENLPAGPDIDKSGEVILVEGRADVITLLKNDITDCIAVGGASGSVPKTIVDLCNAKEVTLFVDGDRGGELIMRSVMEVAEIDFVARAPDGKEVEELTRKEIIKSLRSRAPIEQILSRNGRGHQQPTRNFRDRDNSRHGGEERYERDFQRPQHQQPPSPQAVPVPPVSTPKYQENQSNRVMSPSEIGRNMLEHRDNAPRERYSEERAPRDLGIKDINNDSVGPSGLESIPRIQESQPARDFDSAPLISALDELKNSLRGRLYDSHNRVIAEKPISELIQSIQDTPNINAIVFDGIITQRLVELAHKMGAKMIYGTRASQISRKYDDMMLYTRESGKL